MFGPTVYESVIHGLATAGPVGSESAIAMAQRLHKTAVEVNRLYRIQNEIDNAAQDAKRKHEYREREARQKALDDAHDIETAANKAADKAAVKKSLLGSPGGGSN